VDRTRSFYNVLVNTLIANVTTSFLWFALTFWVYLETRSVLATAIIGGSFMLLVAVVGVPFGTWVDRWRKKRVMVVATSVTAVAYTAAFTFFLLVPTSSLLVIGSLQFWCFVLLILLGAIVESARGIALSTCVTLLVPEERRANMNGLAGMVNGLGFAITSVFSGLAVGQLGMMWTMAIAVALTVVSLLHLLTVAIPEPEIIHAEGAPKAVDFAGAYAAVIAVPGLVGLVLFATFNNLLGGVFMALLAPYGLTLVSVEVWGILWGVLSFGFMIGAGLVAKLALGATPLRALLLANVVMWTIGIFFTIRENIWLTAVGLLAYVAMIPIAEAAEQTVLQKVVPYEKQGRVFGLAQSVEVAAAPVTAFLIGPIAQFWVIPYADSEAGRQSLGWLLGDGLARGIALVFVLAGVLGLLLTFGGVPDPLVPGAVAGLFGAERSSCRKRWLSLSKPRPPALRDGSLVPRETPQGPSAAQAGLPDGSDPLAAQLVQLGTGERLQLAVESQLEQVVGELGIAGQHRTVRIGADDLALHRALGAIVGIADADLHASERRGLRTEGGEAAVVLEPGHQRLGAVRLRPVTEDLPDSAFATAASGDVQQTEALDNIIVLTDGERVADDLVAGTHREQDGAALDGVEDVPVGPEALHSRHLGRVLAAAQKVDRAGGRNGVTGLHLGQGRIDTAPCQPLAQHHGVAAVAVDAQQRLVDKDDLHRAHRRPAIFSRAWNGV